jgi:hypothetical protein
VCLNKIKKPFVCEAAKVLSKTVEPQMMMVGLLWPVAKASAYTKQHNTEI